MDHDILDKAKKKWDPTQAGTMRMLHNGGGYDRKKVKERISDSKSMQCIHCGAEEQTMIHTIWQCPAFKEQRRAVSEAFDDLPLDEIPHCVLIGIPPAMQCKEAASFWGQSLNYNAPRLQQIVGMYGPGPKDTDARQIWQQACGEELNIRQFMEQLKDACGGTKIKSPASRRN